MIHIGIDPGFTGAIATYDDERDEWHVYDMPCTYATTTTRLKSGKFKIRTDLDLPRLVRLLFEQINSCEAITATIEKAQPMRKTAQGATQGTSSTGRYMQAYGMILGALAALSVPYTEVRALTWKRKMAVPSNKSLAIQLAIELIKPLANQLTRQKDHGRAEAGLLCLYNLKHSLAKQRYN